MSDNIRDELIALVDPWTTYIASDGYPSVTTKKNETIADAILARFDLTPKESTA